MPDEPNPNPRFDPPSDEEIEARLRRAIEGNPDDGDPFERTKRELEDIEVPEIPDEPIVRTSMPEVPDFDGRLRELEENAKRARGVQAQKAKRIADEGRSNRGLGFGLTIAYTIVGVPMVGAGIGYLVDRAQGTTVWIGYGTFIGAVLGIVAALFMLNRANNEL